MFMLSFSSIPLIFVIHLFISLRVYFLFIRTKSNILYVLETTTLIKIILKIYRQGHDNILFAWHEATAQLIISKFHNINKTKFHIAIG